MNFTIILISGNFSRLVLLNAFLILQNPSSISLYLIWNNWKSSWTGQLIFDSKQFTFTIISNLQYTKPTGNLRFKKAETILVNVKLFETILVTTQSEDQKKIRKAFLKSQSKLYYPTKFNISIKFCYSFWNLDFRFSCY